MGWFPSLKEEFYRKAGAVSHFQVFVENRLEVKEWNYLIRRRIARVHLLGVVVIHFLGGWEVDHHPMIGGS
jgi:hypothetical protein